MLPSHSDNLRCERCHRLLAAKDKRVSRLDVAGAMLLNNPENVSSQEEAAFGGDPIPTNRVEIADPICDGEPEAGWTVPITMPRLQITNRVL